MLSEQSNTEKDSRLSGREKASLRDAELFELM